MRAFLLALFCFALAGCGPVVVRVPVPPEIIMKANQIAHQADLSFARRDYYAALIKYLEAGRLNPNSEFIQNKIGIAYSQLKFYTEASSAFQRSIALNPKYPYSHNNLGTVHFAAGDKRRAEKLFRRAIGINPKVASFHVNLGTLYFERKKFEKGYEEWRKGLALDPNVLGKSDGITLAASGNQGATSEKHYFMARLYASQGQVERALENLKQAISNGFTSLELIQTEKDFDPIRKDERFLAFMKTASFITKQ